MSASFPPLLSPVRSITSISFGASMIDGISCCTVLYLADDLMKIWILSTPSYIRYKIENKNKIYLFIKAHVYQWVSEWVSECVWMFPNSSKTAKPLRVEIVGDDSPWYGGFRLKNIRIRRTIIGRKIACSGHYRKDILITRKVYLTQFQVMTKLKYHQVENVHDKAEKF